MALQASVITSISPGYNNFFNRAFSVNYRVNSAEVYMRMGIYLVELEGVYERLIRTESIGQKTAGAQTAKISLTDTELRTIYGHLPNTSEGVVEIRLFSYSDAAYTQQVGEFSYQKVKMVIPETDDTRPVVSLTVEPVNDHGAAFDGLFIKGKTKMKVSVEAYGRYEAKITACEVAWFFGEEWLYTDYTTHSQLSVTIELPMDGMTSLEDVLAVSVADSRGITNLGFAEVYAIDYAKPVIDAEAYRCDSAGNRSDSGTYMRVRARRSYSKVVSDGVQKNFCAIQYRIRKADGAWGSWATILERTASSDEVTTGALFGDLETKASYAVQIRAIDDLGEYGETASGLATEEVYMHRTKNSMALGKYAEIENMLDVAWDTHLRGEVFIGPDGKTLRDYILSVVNGG